MKKEHHNYKKRTKYFCVAFGTVITSLIFLLFGAIPVKAASYGDFVINEFLYDPAADITGDANFDGTRNASEDEFVEMVNVTGSPIDMTGWTLSDAVGIRHEFFSDTVVSPGYAIVVFGGGDPLLSVWNNTIVQKASSTTLALSNTGDTITLKDNLETPIWEYIYVGEDINQSLTLSPDLNISGSEVTYYLHSGVHYDGDPFSPGFKLNGQEFGSSAVPIPGAVWLLGSGLIGIVGIRRKFKK